MTHLVQEVELSHVGGLCVQQLVSNVEDPLLDRQLDKERDRERQVKRQSLYFVSFQRFTFVPYRPPSFSRTSC